jgi:hypothetical protein
LASPHWLKWSSQIKGCRSHEFLGFREAPARCFPYDELAKRDKLNLDIFWIKDKTLEDAENLPEPDELAEDIADDLQAALEQFRGIANGLKG